MSSSKAGKPAAIKLSAKIKNLLKTKKFWIRFAAYFCAGIIILVLLLQLILRYFISGAYVRQGIEKAISSSANNAVVSIGSVSASLKGLEVYALSISSDAGPVLYADKLTVAPRFLPLLKGKISLDNILIYRLIINIVKESNGAFNFEALLPKPAKDADTGVKTQESASDFDIYIKTVQFEDAIITYADNSLGTELKLYNTFLDINDFNLAGPFAVVADSDISFKQGSTLINPVSLGFKADVSLASLDLDKAFAKLKTLALRFNESSVSLDAEVNGFKNPQCGFNFKANKLVSGSFKDIFNTPAFDLSSLKVKAAFKADTENSLIKIDKFYFETVFSSASAKGSFNYAAKEPVYNFDASFYNDLQNIPKAVFMAQDFKPSGILSADLNFNNSSKIAGKITAADIGFFTPQAGTFASLNSVITLNSIDDISSGITSGILNGYPFKLKGAYKITPEEGFADLDFKAAKVWIKKTAKAVAETGETVLKPAPSQSLKEAEDNNFKLPPLHIKTNIDIGSLIAPFINASGIVFKADISGVTYNLDKTFGSMSLNTKKGQIKDLYKLTNSNAVTKVLFMSVDIISRVINSLNVLAVLNSLVPQADDGAALTEAQEVAPDGKMDFDSFTSSLTFNKGFTKINQGSLVSSLASFKLKGNMDFNNRKLDMKINAAPGKHYEDGIMPLTIYVGGTIDDPKGSMSLLASTTSLVKQMLLNNFITNAVKGGALSIVDSVSGEKIDPATLKEAGVLDEETSPSLK